MGRGALVNVFVDDVLEFPNQHVHRHQKSIQADNKNSKLFSKRQKIHQYTVVAYASATLATSASATADIGVTAVAGSVTNAASAAAARCQE